MNKFYTHIFNDLFSKADKEYEFISNNDSHKFFPIRRIKSPNLWKDRIIEKKIGQYYLSKEKAVYLTKELWQHSDLINHFEFLYLHLNDEYSKSTLIEVLLFRIFGHKYFKLSVENEKLAELYRRVEGCKIKEQTITIENFQNWNLHLYDLTPLGFNIKLNYVNLGIVNTFGLEQYTYKNGKGVSVKDGDIVLDCGGCWGDTALYFVEKKNTKVYSFEFIPSNIEIFKKNIDLNDKWNQIQLVPSPVWSDSKTCFYVRDEGPASKVSTNKLDDSIPIQSLDIDTFVKQSKLQKVDFIKMDIEGAEINALEGAVDTLKKFRPRLAIALYHSIEDFKQIPEFLHNLNLGYSFYVDHFTEGPLETILFAEIIGRK